MLLAARQVAKVYQYDFFDQLFSYNTNGIIHPSDPQETILVCQLDTRRILKRLAKENLKQLGRMVAKLAHANPMTVLRTIVNQVSIYYKLLRCFYFCNRIVQMELTVRFLLQQIEAYRDMIAPVVDAFKYLTQVRDAFCMICSYSPYALTLPCFLFSCSKKSNFNEVDGWTF